MSHSIEKSTELIKAVYWGTLTKEDLQGVFKNAVNNSEFINRIEDMRKLENVGVGFNELLSFAQELQKMELPHEIKTAIIAGSQLQYGVARMFQSTLNHPQMKVQVFKDELEAREWLLSPE